MSILQACFNLSFVIKESKLKLFFLIMFYAIGFAIFLIKIIKLWNQYNSRDLTSFCSTGLLIICVIVLYMANNKNCFCYCYYVIGTNLFFAT